MNSEEFAKMLLKIRDRFVKEKLPLGPPITLTDISPTGRFYWWERGNNRNNVFFYGIDERFYWLNTGDQIRCYKKPIDQSFITFPTESKIVNNGFWENWNKDSCREIEIE